ncbi:transglutaminase family protein [bacterium SCSIO 12741]|nr:transglutaminase family protein [bacterium SCSIO 12741]
MEAIHTFFNQLEKDIWIELHDGLTALEKLKVINHIIFDVYHFKGNVEKYHAADNSYINRVIETRTGNPISMAILYIIMAERLELPIHGVNLPRHFILAWADEMSQMTNKDHNDPDILFYINPFSGGAVFSRQDIQAFLTEIKLKPNPMFFQPCTNHDIMMRTLNNLANSYIQNKQPEKVEEIRQMQRAMLRNKED